MRELLRSLPVLGGTPPGGLEVDGLPADPADLFRDWLQAALDAAVPEPHATTLATCGVDGVPDARVLILKDLDDVGWWFATSIDTATGAQLDANPAAALTFHWPAVARQVRVRGPVREGPPEAAAGDFRARGEVARAVALASRRSEPVADRATITRAVDEATARLRAEPDLVAPGWRTYAVVADAVEFWQADAGRVHHRVRYARSGTGWRRDLLWP